MIKVPLYNLLNKVIEKLLENTKRESININRSKQKTETRVMIHGGNGHDLYNGEAI